MGKPRVPHLETPPKQPHPLTSAKPKCQQDWTSLKGPPFLLLPALLRAPLSAATAWAPTHWAALTVPVRPRGPAQGWSDPGRVTFPDPYMEHSLTLLHQLPRHELWRWRISATAFAKLRTFVLEGEGLVRRHCPLPEEWRPELCRVKPAPYGALGLNRPGASCASGQRWGSDCPSGALWSHPATLSSLKSLVSGRPSSRCPGLYSSPQAPRKHQQSRSRGERTACPLCPWEIRWDVPHAAIQAEPHSHGSGHQKHVT